MKSTMKQLNRKHIWLVLLTVFITALPISAQQYEKQIKAIEYFVVKQMKVDKIPGLSIGFYKDDFIWAKGFGYADLENKTPASARSAYRLASNTKSMTAVAILQLVEQGKVDLDAEVQTYVPYFPRKRWPVTVRQLLGHLGGISHYRNHVVESHIKEHKDTRDALAIFADFDLVAEPGTKYNYSSYGYNLLGAVVEGAARQPYGDYLRENLWEPLGMDDTHMDDPGEILPNRVRGYRLIDGEVKNSEYVDISSRFAAGGTRSTVIDLLKYARGLNTTKVLSRESIDLMHTPMTKKDGRYIIYGMGWRIAPVNGHFHAYHTGSQAETRTLLARFPEENLAIALAYNLEGADRLLFAHRLFQLVMDESWNIGVITGSRDDDALYSGLLDAFNYGLAYFDRYKQPLTTDPEELSAAFAYFNACVNRDSLRHSYHAARKKIRDGRHPVAKEAFVKIGSYMAVELKEKHSSQHIEQYHKSGAISFFNDYVRMYQKESDHPAEHRISGPVEKIIAAWSKDWEKTCTDYTRRLAIAPYSNLDEIGKKLKKTFSGASVYPDFSQEFARATEYFCINGDHNNAYKAAKLAIGLYPDAPLPSVWLANAYASFGEKDKARKTYKKALEIDPSGETLSAWSLNQYAMNLIYSGKLEQATALLEIALELYPENAGLCTSMADIYLKKGKIYYQKSLKLDPTLETARERLIKIQ